MRKSQLTEAQIVGVLQKGTAGGEDHGAVSAARHQ